MRHFLPVVPAPAGLPGRVMPPAPKRLLVADACPSQAIATCLSSAFPGAITLAVVAAPADPQLATAPGTVQQSIALDDTHHISCRPWTGQRDVIASSYPQRDRRTAAITMITSLTPGRLEAATSGLRLF
ncbi:MAG: hypothetical protein MUF54_14745 [Polyangiaceae bacterium]|nr:hypothetical protein [Polyangiaceae bacterium]